eukprot:TRINITY_DN5556_c0_g1_i18.p1 TRINITY_DN5556_c0_g1~~TRINITY_DN5556_c0_g1_i18.p1  ORF type:complete len:637 (-),score=61.73 TRINITY_DN5556_c0_g1_i18:392-2302(-)
MSNTQTPMAATFRSPATNNQWVHEQINQLMTPYYEGLLSTASVSQREKTLPRSAEALGTPAVMQMYQRTIKMVQENKINVKNAWDIGLIDKLPQVIRKVGSVGQGGFGLEAATKLYFLRVQNLHSRCVESVQSYHQKDKKQSEQDDGENDGQNGQSKLRRKIQIMDPSLTLASKEEDINLPINLNPSIQRYKNYNTPKTISQHIFALASKPMFEHCHFAYDQDYIPFIQSDNLNDRESNEKYDNDHSLSLELEETLSAFRRAVSAIDEEEIDFSIFDELSQILSNQVSPEDRIDLAQYLSQLEQNECNHTENVDFQSYNNDDIAECNLGIGDHRQSPQSNCKSDLNNLSIHDDYDIQQDVSNYIKNGYSKKGTSSQLQWGQENRQTNNRLNMTQLKESFRALSTSDNVKLKSRVHRKKRETKSKSKNPNIIDFESEVDQSIFEVGGEIIQKPRQISLQPTLIPEEVDNFVVDDYGKLNLLNCSLEQFFVMQAELKQTILEQNFEGNIVDFGYENEGQTEYFQNSDKDELEGEDDIVDTSGIPTPIANDVNTHPVHKNHGKRQKYYFVEEQQPDIDSINKQVVQTIQRQSLYQDVVKSMEKTGVSESLAFLSCLFLYNQQHIEFNTDNNGELKITKF